MTELPKLKICLNTSEEDLAKELYEPCLKWAERYDRGVGYFTSGWLSYNTVGMSDFASRGGKMRLITSPIISSKDHDTIISAKTFDEKYKCFVKAMNQSVDMLSREMEKDLLNAFAWMVYDGIIDIKFAVPKMNLGDGNFHDKFGVFYKGQEIVSFSGSQNDSIQGFCNYESIKVFCSWHQGAKAFANSDKIRFEKIWNGRDINLDVYSIEESIRKNIFTFRTGDRPYKKISVLNKWAHQDKAVEIFLEKNNGILAMATGTGKTRTAIKIIKELFHRENIKRVIITMRGNDLLDQWSEQISENFDDKQIYHHYGEHKQLQKFILIPDEAILLVSQDADYLAKTFSQFQSNDKKCTNDTLLIFDEVHGAGSNSIVQGLKGQVSSFKYKLGLSATPEREYDEVGNDFIEQEIGPVIFTFSLKEAIEKNILCGFNYYPLKYSLTEEERKKKRAIIKTFSYKKKMGEAYSEADVWTQLSLVNKIAKNKLLIFRDFIESNPRLLDKCIIFVQTKEYGLEVQNLIFDKCSNYHTYFAEDEKANLVAFSNGNLDCLITCQKLSEGIDISSVTNIILFASDRSKLVTTQRIGRALRLDENSPNKIANVVDFILDDINTDNPEESTDNMRETWLTELSKVRSKNEK